jgi:hypothetical protein
LRNRWGVLVAAALCVAPTAVAGSRVQAAAAPGRPATLALLDSGVDPAGLRGLQLGAGYNAVDGGTSTSDADVNGHHGTNMASIVASVLSARDLGALCDRCTLVPVVIGTSTGPVDEAVVRGLGWAAQRRPAVINLSLPGNAPSGSHDLIATAYRQGTTVVVAAGNSGSDDPAADPLASGNEQAAITVAAVGPDNRLIGPSGSNRGSDHGAWVDIAAPGGATSGAAAYVSATVLLLKAFAPALSPAEIKGLLTSTGTRVPGLDVACHCVVDLRAALARLGYPGPARTALSVRRRPGVGAITSVPAGISCGGKCTARFPVGATVRLTARARAGRTIRWNGCQAVSRSACSTRIGAAPILVTATAR